MRRSSRKARLTGSITVAALVLPLSLMSVGAAAAAPPHDDNNAGGNQPPSNSSAPNKAPAVESRVKDIIKVNGRQFRDLNDNGTLDPYEDWRLTDEQRAADLVSRMTLEEKAGLMQITSLRGDIPDLVENRNIRYLIIRDNPTAFELAERANTHQQTAEATRLGIPLVFTSNPRNHVNPDLEFGISEAAGQFSSWPGSLGLAATNDLDLIRDFAEIAQDEWRSSGIQKAYAYQLETATEPRWRRINGTFGESPDLNAAIATRAHPGLPGRGAQQRERRADREALPRRRRGAARARPAQRARQVGRLPDARQPRGVPAAAVPGRDRCGHELGHVVLQRAEQRHERRPARHRRLVRPRPAVRRGRRCVQQGDRHRPAARPHGLHGLREQRQRHPHQPCLRRREPDDGRALREGDRGRARACSPTTTTRRDSSRRSRPACSPSPTCTPRCNCCSRRSSRSACSRTRMSTPTSPSRSRMTLPRRPVPTRRTTSRSC